MGLYLSQSYTDIGHSASNFLRLYPLRPVKTGLVPLSRGTVVQGSFVVGLRSSDFLLPASSISPNRVYVLKLPKNNSQRNSAEHQFPIRAGCFPLNVSTKSYRFRQLQPGMPDLQDFP
jgi:hypothetical protein